MANKNQGPAINATPPQKSPAAAVGANVATKTSGSFGSSSEGNVAGKGPNKPR
jgi:hypothetical protein